MERARCEVQLIAEPWSVGSREPPTMMWRRATCHRTPLSHRGLSFMPADARFKDIIARSLDMQQVKMRETHSTGRGLYFCGPHAEMGSLLIRPTTPIAQCAADKGELYEKLIAQLILKSCQGQDQDDIKVLLSLLAFPSNLLTMHRSAEEEAKVKRSIAEVIRIVNASTTQFELVALDEQQYLQYWGILYLNAIRSATPSHLSLYGVLSLLNHSCSPTVGLRFDDQGRAGAVALGTMLPGTQLTVNYIEVQAAKEKWTKKQQRQYLYEQYGIHCTSSAACVCKRG